MTCGLSDDRLLESCTLWVHHAPECSQTPGYTQSEGGTYQAPKHLASCGDFDPSPGACHLEAPVGQQLLLHKAPEALAIGHPQRYQPALHGLGESVLLVDWTRAGCPAALCSDSAAVEGICLRAAPARKHHLQYTNLVLWNLQLRQAADQKTPQSAQFNRML